MGWRKPWGKVVLGFIFTVWIFSPVFCLLIAPLLLYLGHPIPMICVAVYIAATFVLAPPRPWAALHHLLCKTMTNYPYFRSQRLLFQSDKAIPMPDSGSLLAVMPHGLLCTGYVVNVFMSPLLLPAKFTFLGADQAFRFPLFRELLYWNGTEPITPVNMSRVMSEQRNVALLCGGFEDIALFKKGSFSVFIKERKGFIKYALRFGYTVYPVFSFGEEQTYSAMSSFLQIRLFLARFGIPAAVFSSRFGYLPNMDELCRHSLFILLLGAW